MTADALKILICDDSFLSRRQLNTFLLSIGYSNIVEASDGNAAVEAYKKEHPTLVFLDLVMPNKDGFEAMQEIMDYDKDANIIVVSSVGTQTNLKKVLELGAKDFIQKPLNTLQVQSIIKKVLKGGL